MTNRRKFLRQSGTFALAGLVMPKLGSANNFFGEKPKWPIGLQLYTLGDLMTTDVKGTLQKLAAIGYKELESAGFKFSSYAYGIHFVKTGWIFERGKIFVHLYVNQDMSIEPTKVEDRCVKQILISVN